MSEEKMINDSVFGELSYTGYSYEKEQTVNLFGKDHALTIQILSEEITDVERDFYKKFQDILISENAPIIEEIKEYSSGTYPEYDYGDYPVPFESLINPQPADYLDPTSVVFSGDRWGVLFETIYEEEHGFAIWFEKDKDLEVFTGFQDNLF